MHSNIDLGKMLFESEPFCINVLDVGAIHNPGEEAPYAGLVQDGHARVVGFEPDEAGCARLNESYGPPHRFFPHFVGDGKPAVFYETNWALTGSLYKPNRPLLEKFGNLHEVTTLRAEHPVDTVRLDDIEGLGDIDFIKIDVQGAELSVFRGGPRILREAVVIQTEVEFVELYLGQPLFADVDRALRAAGYQFHTFLGLGSRCFKPVAVDGNLNKGMRQLLWADAIYIKDWMNLESLPEAKLKKMAIILHEIVKSPDLCYFVLSHLDARLGTKYAKQYGDALFRQTARS